MSGNRTRLQPKHWEWLLINLREGVVIHMNQRQISGSIWWVAILSGDGVNTICGEGGNIAGHHCKKLSIKDFFSTYISFYFLIIFFVYNTFFLLSWSTFKLWIVTVVYLKSFWIYFKFFWWIEKFICYSLAQGTVLVFIAHYLLIVCTLINNHRHMYILFVFWVTSSQDQSW